MSAEGSRPPEKRAFQAPEAPTFRCPSCGAPAAKDARACVHCGSLLATKRCVTCFALSPREAHALRQEQREIRQVMVFLQSNVLAWMLPTS